MSSDTAAAHPAPNALGLQADVSGVAQEAALDRV